jgi:apolipoprotein N-acyltransferase
MRVNSPYDGQQAASYGLWLMGFKTIQLYWLARTVNISRTPCLPFHFVLALSLLSAFCSFQLSFLSIQRHGINQTSRFSGWFMGFVGSCVGSQTCFVDENFHGYF